MLNPDIKTLFGHILDEYVSRQVYVLTKRSDVNKTIANADGNDRYWLTEAETTTGIYMAYRPIENAPHFVEGISFDLENIVSLFLGESGQLVIEVNV